MSTNESSAEKIRPHSTNNRSDGSVFVQPTPTNVDQLAINIKSVRFVVGFILPVVIVVYLLVSICSHDFDAYSRSPSSSELNDQTQASKVAGSGLHASVGFYLSCVGAVLIGLSVLSSAKILIWASLLLSVGWLLHLGLNDEFFHITEFLQFGLIPALLAIAIGKARTTLKRIELPKRTSGFGTALDGGNTVSGNTVSGNDSELSVIVQRMAEMSGQIAHDLNNHLLSIMINIDLIRLELNRGGNINEQRLADLERGSMEAKLFCKDLITFSGSIQKRDFQIVDLVDCCQNVVDKFQQLVSTSIRLDFENHLTQGKGCVAGDPLELQKALDHLFSIAMDFVGERGEINLAMKALSGKALAEADLNGRDKLIEIEHQHDAYCEVICAFVPAVESNRFRSLQDPIDRAKLFDPTKTGCPKKGGAGLSTIWGITRSHEGTMELDIDSLGAWEIRIYLPLAEKEWLARQSVKTTESSGIESVSD